MCLPSATALAAIGLQVLLIRRCSQETNHTMPRKPRRQRNNLCVETGGIATVSNGVRHIIIIIIYLPEV